MRHPCLTLLLCCACLGGFGALAGPATAAPNIEATSFSLSSIQAGAHPDFSAAVALEDAGDPETAKEVRFGLPPGFFLYPNTISGCEVEVLLEEDCGTEGQVGTIALTGDYEGDPDHEFAAAPLYLLPPEAGELMQLGFIFPEVEVPVIAPVTVRTTDQGIDIALGNFPQTVPLASVTVTLWGVPADPIHDEERGGPSSEAAAPFTRSPTSCEAPGSLAVRVASWQKPGEPASAAAAAPAIGGCGKLAFFPSFDARLTSHEASAPAGLFLDFDFASSLTPNGLTTADAKTIDTTLPPEVSLEEEALTVLTACSLAQAHLEGGPNECPSGSELGATQITIAGTEQPLEGNIYFGGDETTGSYRLFLIAGGEGIELRRQGSLTFDAVSGGWKVDLPNLPQLPIVALEMAIDSGDGPFSTPRECGIFDAEANLTPWSGSAAARATDGLAIETGPAGGPCPGPAEKVVVSLDPTSIAADGVSTTTATATVSEANGYLVPGDEIVFESTDPEQKIGPVTDHGDGTYTARITASNVPGTSVVYAYDETVLAEVFGLAELTQTAVPAPPLFPAATPPPPPSVSPVVKLRGRPAKKTRDRTPTFHFTSSVPGSSFQCRVDRRALRRCKSPLTLGQLAFGHHTFKVRAIAPDGLASPFATYEFVVRRGRPAN
jgi:hypothetical protein